MNAPFFKFGLFGDDVSLIVAFFIGIGFGFFLERGGFGSSVKLAAQFYFTDMTVLKVMFTAIVTAMVGLFYLSWIGFVDLSQVYVSTTFLVPQMLGGVILGIGFVIAGYCPGTSIVGAATGRLDGVACVLGLFAGIFVFGEAFPLFSDFYVSTNLGRLTLPEVFNMSYGMVVFLVVAMAVGAFYTAEWAERKFGGKKIN